MQPSLSPSPVATTQTGTFGPAPHNAWALESDGSVNLVRTAKPPRPLRLPAQPQAITLDLARSALVVVDMQNDFCHPEGWFGQRGQDVRPMRRPIAEIARLLRACRRADMPIVWLNWGVREDCRNLSPAVLFKGKRSVDGVGYAECSPVDRGPSLVPGSWGAAVVDELAVQPGDIAIDKHRLSGFWDNELDSTLRQQGVTTLLFAGVNTDRCVFSTLQDAAFLGYDCVLLHGACGTPSPSYVTRAIYFLVQRLHGFVAESRALRAALSAASSGGASCGTPAAKRSASRQKETGTADKQGRDPRPSQEPSNESASA
jgi:ureidoacrylate peracid hydrolase